MNKLAVIVSGNFSTGVDANGKAKQGNFSGLTASEKEGFIFISKKKMNALGFNEDKDVKFPLYTNLIERQIGMLDADAKPVMEEDGVTPKTITRIQGGAVFTKKEELFAALTSERLVDVEAEAQFQKEASVIGFTDEQLKALEAVNV